MKKLRGTHTVYEYLKIEELTIPSYQRPYKWTLKNISDMMQDIDDAMKMQDSLHGSDYRYRFGTIILNIENDTYEIVDGQQRTVSLLLLSDIVFDNENFPLLSKQFGNINKTTESNIIRNYRYIKEYVENKPDGYKDKLKDLLKTTLEVVAFSVDKISEAFQLFDCQNTRGKPLEPHDLLKAYHLREMKGYPYDMRHAVVKWEAVDSDAIKDLFAKYLYPIQNWVKGNKTIRFTAKEIDEYKGISEYSPYSYAIRARKASPCFQIAEPYTSGKDFFDMVDYYLHMSEDIENEINNNEGFSKIKSILENKDHNQSTGFGYAKNLFFCALLCYYDRFRNFEPLAVKKLFLWAFMLRTDMKVLGYDSINKYAIGQGENQYSNKIAMFSIIANARKHTEISGLQINITNKPDERWKNLLDELTLVR